MQTITVETFFKLLHDTANDGFSIRYRRASDGKTGVRHGCRKPQRKHPGAGPGQLPADAGHASPGHASPGLRYDVLEKGIVLLEDAKGEKFSLRNRLLMAYRFRGQTEWYRIKHTY